ncbi:hypothetical protein N431DRAFT_558659 [Stipitochalara longipes BDJ]|nr:hypothetical protein N431DRAFT_558659 [Stipitochalara longipes BDJ]
MFYPKPAEVLRQTASILAAVADASLNQSPNSKNATFLESIRTEFKFLRMQLDQIATDDNALNIKMLSPLFKVINNTISEEGLRQAVERSNITLPPVLSQFTPIWRTYARLCQLYHCSLALPNLDIEANLRNNPALLRKDFDQFAQEGLLRHLRHVIDILSKKRAAPSPNWHHHATRTVRDRLERLHEALKKNWSESDPSSNDKTLNSCQSAKLLLEGTWSATLPGATSFQVLLCGPGYIQESRILDSLDCQPKPTDANARRVQDCEIEQDLCYRVHLDQNGLLWQSWQFESEYDEDLGYSNNHPILLPKSKAVYYTEEAVEISLGNLVMQKELTYSEKSILSIVLANSLLHIFGSKWLKEAWTLADISLFCYQENPDSGTPLLLDMRRPYVSIKVRDPERSEIDQGQNSQNAIHHSPQILRLGIVFMELALGDKLSQFYETKDHSRRRTETKVNDLLGLAKRQLEQCKKRFSPRTPILNAAERCIDHRRYVRCGYNDYKDPDFLMEVYQDIVLPLEENLLKDLEYQERSGKSVSLQSVLDGAPTNPIASFHEQVLSVFSELLVEPQSSPMTGQLYKSENGSFNGIEYDLEDMTNCESDNEEKQWLSWLDHLKTMHTNLTVKMTRMDLSKSDHERLIKVAILDTGCDLFHPKIVEFNQRGSGRYIAGYKDFVDEMASGMTDNAGHGTFLTHLFLQVIRFAKVYVVRVFNRTDADQGTVGRIDAGIRYAINQWDVDIISMSFSLNGNPVAIEDAIDFAASKNVLMFAAASNNKLLEDSPIGFPATLGQRVICINSHKGNRKRSDFSPPPIHGRVNFALPGEGVKAAILGTGEEGVKRGTSCATPIAAAVAATILDYSVYFRDESMGAVWAGGRNRLKELNVMKTVLLKYMTEDERFGHQPLDAHYRNITPWKLFNKKETEISSMLREVALERVRLNVLH